MSDSMTTPADVAARFTHTFIREAMADRRKLALLEVGCGAGALAARLAGDGHTVVAIDKDPKCIGLAEARGMDARCVEWLAFRDGLFDAILFTRSLHHLEPLAEVVDHAWSMLRPGGRVVVEDFAFSSATAPTATWLATTASMLMGNALPELPDTEFLSRVASAPDALEAWHADFGHHIHGASDMAEALDRRGNIIAASEAPYLFRYFCAAASENAVGAQLAERVLDAETRLINASTIEPIGRRWVVE